VTPVEDLGVHVSRALLAYEKRQRANGAALPAGWALLSAAFPDRGRQETTNLAEDDGDGDTPLMALALNLRRIGDALDVSERTVQRLVISGELPSVKIGKARRVRVDDLQRFVADLNPAGAGPEDV
jgi:excisionase family DNA binding protein